MRAIGSLAVLGALACAAGPVSAQAAQRAGLPTAISLPPEIDAVLRAYESAWQSRDAAALAALFTADGFVLRPGHPPVTGRSAIETAYAGSGGPLALTAYAFATEGGVGYVIGGYGADRDRPEIGKFVLALRRAPTGTWQIAADIDNGN